MALTDDLSVDTITDAVNIGGVSSVLTGVITYSVIALFVGIITYFVIKHYKFKSKIIIFKKIGGRWEDSKRDRAMEVRFGLGGDKLFYLQKLRKYIPIPEIQTGRNTYWLFQRRDGELINFEMEDLDEASKKMGAKFLDKEMRFSRVSLQSHWKERYDKPKFWEKYGTLVINIILIVIIMVFVFLILDKHLSSVSQLNAMLETATELQEVNKQVLGALENVCTSSGIVR